MPFATCHGLGTMLVLSVPIASCHSATSTTANATGRSQRSNRMREPDLREQAVAQLEVARRAEIARARDIDVDDLANAPRPGRHHDDAIGELHRLVDVVR